MERTIRKFKKALSMILAAAMVITLMPAQSAYAAGGEYSSQAVQAPAPGAYISGENSVEEGDTIQLTAHGFRYYDWGEWSSSDESIATVDSYGYVTGVSAGQVTIKYTAGDYNFYIFPVTKKEASVTIEVTATSKYIEGPSEVRVKETITLTAVGVNNYRNKEWNTSDKKVATVNKDGVVTGVKEGNVTISCLAYNNNKNHGITLTYDIKVLPAKPDNTPVYVAVYATGGNSNDSFTSDMKKELGVNYVQRVDHYAPIGVITLPKSMFTGTSPYIRTDADLAAVMQAMSVIDQSYLINRGAENRGNTVGSHLEYVQMDYNGTIGSGKTALFDWNYPEEKNAPDNNAGPSIALIDGKNYKYHLDLRFATNVLSFTSVKENANGSFSTGNTGDLGTRTYLTGMATIEPGDSDDWYLNIGSEYQISGYYSDAKCTVPYIFGNAITSDTNVFVKIVRQRSNVTYDLAGGVSATAQLSYNNLTIGSNTPKIAEPTKTAHTFAGWQDDLGNRYKNNDSIPKQVTRSVTYTALWESKGYTLEITAKDATFKYNGTVQSATEYTVTSNPFNLTFTGISAYGEGKDVKDGGYEIKVTKADNFKAYDNGVDVTAFVTVTLKPGTLTILPREVTFKTGTAQKEYDGSPLTKAGVEIEGDEIVSGDIYDIKATGSQLVEGSSSNTLSYTFKDGVPGDNYSITESLGTLKVVSSGGKYELTATPAGYEGTYDGQAHRVNTYTLAGSVITGSTGTFTYNGHTYTISGVSVSDDAVLTDVLRDANGNVISKKVSIVISDGKKIVDEFGNDVTKEFTIKTAENTIKINPVELTFTSPDASKSYDGTALTTAATDMNITGSFVGTDGVDFTMTGSVVYGEAKNTFTYTAKTGTNLDNYTISETVGTLKVLKGTEEYKIELVSKSDTVTYDGKEHSVTGFETLSFTIEGIKYSVSGVKTGVKATDAGKYVNAITSRENIVITDTKNNIVVTDAFDVSYKEGTLTVDPRPITLKSDNESFEFDNKLHTPTKDAYVSKGSFVDGQGVTYEMTGSQKLVGSSANSFSYSAKAGTNIGNYAITKEVGQLTVTNRSADTKYEITVEANSYSGVYDGTEHTVTGFKTLTFTVDGSEYTVSGLTTNTVTAKDVTAKTSVNIDGTVVVKTSDGIDATESFKVNMIPGSFEITKRALTFTSPSASKDYDGTPLKTLPGAMIVTGSFAPGESATFTMNNAIVYPGDIDNEYTYVINNGLASNYDITELKGKLHIDPRGEGDAYRIDVKPQSLEAVYNGKSQGVSGSVETEFTNEANGLKYTVTVYTKASSRKDVGEQLTEVERVTVKDSNGVDVTAQFRFNKSNGLVKITPRPIEFTSASGQKIYDYTTDPLKVEKVNVTSGSLAEGDVVTYNVTGSQTYVGSSENTYTVVWGTVDVNNYAPIYKVGKLEVLSPDTKYEVTVKAASGTFLYDGSEKSVNGFADTMANLTFTQSGDSYIGTLKLGDNTFTIEGLNASYKTTDAGEYTVKVTGTAVVKDSEGTDVTGQFIVNTQPGTLKIDKRTVTVTAVSKTFTYDAKEHYAKDVTISGDKFAAGEGATYVFSDTSKITAPGHVDNVIASYTLNAGTKADNYIIKTVKGQLTVINRTGDEKYVIKLVPNSDTVMYDGTEKSVSGFIATSFTVPGLDGKTYTVTGVEASATGIDAGVYPVTATGTSVVTDAAGNDVTGSFVVTVDDSAKLVIKPRKVTITAASEERPFDNTSLTNSDYTITGDGFVEGEEPDITVTGTILIPGTVTNEVTYKLDDDVNPNNYEITTVNGQLTVTKVDGYQIVLEPNSATFAEDGTEKSIEGFTTYTFDVSGNTYTVDVDSVTAKASGIEPGEYPVEINGSAVVRNEKGEDVTEAFSVSYGTGTLTIQAVYSLTINYVDENGDTLAPSYSDRLVEGSQFGPIMSPEIEDHTPSVSAVMSSTEGIKSNLVYNVVYTKDAEPETITPDVPTPGDEPTSDEPTSDEPTPDEPTPENPTPDEPTPNEPTPDEPEPELIPAEPVPTVDEPAQEFDNPPVAVVSFDENGDPVITLINDEATALAAGTPDSFWALINLLAAILAVGAMICVLFNKLQAKKKEDEEEDETVKLSDEDLEEINAVKRRQSISALIGIVVAVASVVLLITTQDFSQPMAYVDKWTIPMVLITFCELGLSYLALKKKKKENEAKEETKSES